MRCWRRRENCRRWCLTKASLLRKQGRLTDTAVSTLRQSGLFSLFVPRALGGAELWPAPGIEIIETLTRADGSTGWVVMATQVAMATCAAYLPPTAAKAVFKNHIPIIAGQGAPVGRADTNGNGYVLSGNWSYGSGLLHSEWIHTGAIVHHNGAPRIDPRTQHPEARIFIVPVDKAALQNNWDVLGLRATGSVDYSMRDVAVAEEYTHSLGVKRPQTGGDLYRLGIIGFAAMGHTGFALGIARRTLDEIAALATSQSGRPTPVAGPGGGENFQLQYGRAEGQLRAARAFVFEVWEEIQRTLEAATMQRCDRYRSRGSRLLMRTLSRRQLPILPLNSAAGPRCAPEIFNDASEISVRRLSISQRPRISFASARRTCLALHKEKFGICGNWLTLERAALPVAISAGIQSI